MCSAPTAPSLWSTRTRGSTSSPTTARLNPCVFCCAVHPLLPAGDPPGPEVQLLLRLQPDRELPPLRGPGLPLYQAAHHLRLQGWAHQGRYPSRSRIHERTITLRFLLGIILRVLRLEVSVWIFLTHREGGSVADPGYYYPGSEFFPSRILDPNFAHPESASKNLSILTQKNYF